MNEEKREVLESAYSYCNKVIQRFDQIIEEMKDGLYSAGEDLSDGLEGIIWLADVLQHTKEIHGITLNFDDLKEKFALLLNSIENEDYKYASEILENEFMMFLSDWFDGIEESLE